VVNIVQKVGYQTKSPDTVDPESVNKYYTALNITPTSTHFQNGREYSRFNKDKSWKQLLKPVDRDDWSMTAPTVNAYYNPSGNEIVFPAGIMQLPVFQADLPEYANYGAFGAVAGHELSHAFDNHGSNFNERGILQNWWDNHTRSNFDKKTECFVDQYSKYTVLGPGDEVLNVNGKLTLGENIADAGGLTASYRAWKLREKETPNPKLPGLEHFTNDQMFFLGYSAWWCSKVRPAQRQSYIFTDVHSPADKRIIGTTANSEAFREAFNCPAKKATCELW
jgi:endothelin-converting enzyme